MAQPLEVEHGSVLRVTCLTCDTFGAIGSETALGTEKAKTLNDAGVAHVHATGHTVEIARLYHEKLRPLVRPG